MSVAVYVCMYVLYVRTDVRACVRAGTITAFVRAAISLLLLLPAPIRHASDLAAAI